MAFNSLPCGNPSFSRRRASSLRLDIPRPLVYEPRLNSKQRAEALRPDGR
jgi:hypothetical protein